MVLTKMGSTSKIPKVLLALCAVLFASYAALSAVEASIQNRIHSGVNWNKESLVQGRNGWLKRPYDKSLITLSGNKKNLPLLAFFSLPNCPYCNLMQRTVFANKLIYSLINANFYPVIIDGSDKLNSPSVRLDDRTFDDRYHSMLVPRLVVAMPDGCPLWSFTGVRSCSKTYTFLKVAVRSIEAAKEKAERLEQESQESQDAKKLQGTNEAN